MNTVLELVLSHPVYAGALFCVALLIVRYALGRLLQKTVKSFPRKYPSDANKKKTFFYHVAIVGAGPAGSTAGYYLAKKGWNCLLLEKKKFPRDKYCGDAVCKTAIEILIDMGVYQQLLEEKKAHVADNGGLCSPGGLSYVGRSKEMLGEIPAAIACKRINLDNAIAMAAKRAGVHLRENCSVSKAVFDKKQGLWTISLEGVGITYKARVLVCADGAPSTLGRSLGLVKTPPGGTCSRSYVEPGTHKFKADGVVFYNRGLLPGYAALFRHHGDELNYCVYIIPGNPKVTNDDLPHWHEYLKTKDPNISRALGKNFKIERMKAASLRLGGEPVSYSDHVILVGDAAGMIDPMTGEGIHHAMDGGKIAANFLDEALLHGNYDNDMMKIYHERWMKQFGHDFVWSNWICKLLYRFPILLDAATAAVSRKGDKFLARWADIMTGRVPKIHLLKPEFVIVITFELFKLIGKRLVGIKPKSD
ncbi:conditioned medium factor receptor 1-like [Saccoglossus kowalevskii]|uniref:Conditioned medium factor receptor 1-like n=1 Tax=Saccoglossus kowalevskii TaxID=10224 RepID=A0ABM0GNG0_SACKO|nr:PREDICTED: conditioned medium factor receptor 1-like [Saccoglossus kowalevskii]